MNARFDDITSRIAEPPVWYDENGTPRYGEFTPEACPCIYARNVVLLLVACQDCGNAFLVEMHDGIWQDKEWMPAKLHYGDPPSHGCVGDTMNCTDLEVVECWHRAGIDDWKRHPEHEGLIDDG